MNNKTCLPTGRREFRETARHSDGAERQKNLLFCKKFLLTFNITECHTDSENLRFSRGEVLCKATFSDRTYRPSISPSSTQHLFMPQPSAEYFDRSYSIKSSSELPVLCAATAQFKYRFNGKYRRAESHRRLYAAVLSEFRCLVQFHASESKT